MQRHSVLSNTQSDSVQQCKQHYDTSKLCNASAISGQLCSCCKVNTWLLLLAGSTTAETTVVTQH
jgi:hypothetical protein